MQVALTLPGRQALPVTCAHARHRPFCSATAHIDGVKLRQSHAVVPFRQTPVAGAPAALLLLLLLLLLLPVPSVHQWQCAGYVLAAAHDVFSPRDEQSQSTALGRHAPSSAQ